MGKTTKLTIEFVRGEFLKRKGYILLSEIYIDSKTPLKYQCPHHPNEDLQICWSSFDRGNGCKFCGAERIGVARRFEYDFVKSEFMRLKGYILLDSEYKDITIPMRYTCPNHPNEELCISFNNLKKGQGCKFCAIENKLENNKNDYINKLKNKNVVLLDEYTDGRISLKHKCLICDYEFYDKPYFIINKNWKCNSCYPNCKNVVFGVNSVFDTNKELFKLLKNPEDGYKYMESSSKKVDWVCPECHTVIRERSFNNVNRGGLSCSVCSDNGFSLPQRFVASILKSLSVEFKSEKVFDWCKFKFNDKYVTGRYDFYFTHNNEPYIIEVDGGFHFNKKPIDKTMTNKDIRYLDQQKECLAISNGINVIRIDCQKSTLEYIKNSILGSELKYIFDLSHVNFEECYKNALKSNIVQVCDCWSDGMKLKDISETFGISSNTVIRYLKRGADANLCDYNSKFRYNVAESNMRKACDLWNDGESLFDIAKILELSKDSIRNYLKKCDSNGLCNYQASVQE